MKIIGVCTFLLILIEVTIGQILFPEHFEQDKKKSNLEGRLPLYAPKRCRKNELLYPGDQLNDWICDCAPANVFHPETELCFPVFRQGPCPNGEILVLYPRKVVPECIKNDCGIDGQVKINNVCYTIGEPNPCKHQQLSFVLGVNPKSLQLDCVRESMSLASRFGDPTPETVVVETPIEDVDLCARGTKRVQNNLCQTLSTTTTAPTTNTETTTESTIIKTITDFFKYYLQSTEISN